MRPRLTIARESAMLAWSRQEGVVPDFRNFKVLLDAPTTKPALGFDDYALAFADVILHSSPQFAIGIFGDWGSGKTTLMDAIKRELEVSDVVIPVSFNAWRYEREEHLIVPLLDTLREGLVNWSDEAEREGGERNRARQAASTVGRAARALFAGLTFRANVAVAADPGGIELSITGAGIIKAAIILVTEGGYD